MRYSKDPSARTRTWKEWTQRETGNGHTPQLNEYRKGCNPNVSAEIKSEQVKELREKTGAGMMDCKQALAASGGNLEKAIDYLRKKGAATAEKRADRITNQGLVEAYIHAGGRIGAMVEINCETDFVAKTNDFRALAKDLAMQI